MVLNRLTAIQKYIFTHTWLWATLKRFKVFNLTHTIYLGRMALPLYEYTNNIWNEHSQACLTLLTFTKLMAQVTYELLYTLFTVHYKWKSSHRFTFRVPRLPVLNPEKWRHLPSTLYLQAVLPPRQEISFIYVAHWSRQNRWPGRTVHDTQPVQCRLQVTGSWVHDMHECTPPSYTAWRLYS